jgi:hypothetical protein
VTGKDEQTRTVNPKALFKMNKGGADQPENAGNPKAQEGEKDEAKGTGGGLNPEGNDQLDQGLQGRGLVGDLPRPSYPGNKSGKVVIRVTVDKTGRVTNAVYEPNGSTSSDNALVQAASVRVQKGGIVDVGNTTQTLNNLQTEAGSLLTGDAKGKAVLNATTGSTLNGTLQLATAEKTGSAEMVLNSTDNSWEQFIVKEGTLRVGVDNALSEYGVTRVESGATLNRINHIVCSNCLAIVKLHIFTQGKGIRHTIRCNRIFLCYRRNQSTVYRRLYQTLKDVKQDFIGSCRHCFVRVKTVQILCYSYYRGNRILRTFLSRAAAVACAKCGDGNK